MREEDDVVRPLAKQVRMVDRAGICSDDADRLVANLPAVAVGAVEKVSAPTFSRTRDVRQLIDGARREQEPAAAQGATARQSQREARPGLDDLVVDDLDAVALDFGAADREQVGRRHPIAGQEGVHVRRG